MYVFVILVKVIRVFCSDRSDEVYRTDAGALIADYSISEIRQLLGVYISLTDISRETSFDSDLTTSSLTVVTFLFT